MSGGSPPHTGGPPPLPAAPVPPVPAEAPPLPPVPALPDAPPCEVVPPLWPADALAPAVFDEPDSPDVPEVPAVSVPPVPEAPAAWLGLLNWAPSSEPPHAQASSNTTRGEAVREVIGERGCQKEGIASPASSPREHAERTREEQETWTHNPHGESQGSCHPAIQGVRRGGRCRVSGNPCQASVEPGEDE